METAPSLSLVLPPVVRVPLGGVAEIDVRLRDEPDDSVEIAADTSTPGLVGVPGSIRRFETLGSIRAGAAAPLMVGETFTLRVTARSRMRAGTAETSAVVVGRTGSLDPSFGGGTGTFVAQGSKYERDGFTDVEVEPDGSVLATGRHSTMVGLSFRAVHVLADGSGDPAWSPRGHAVGAGGVITVQLNENHNWATAFAIGRQSTGRVVLAGVDHRHGDRIALAGLRPDGSLDETFGDRGVVHFSPDGGNAAALAMAVAPDDALVLVGHVGWHALVARILPDGTPDPAFADGGQAVLDPVADVGSEARGVTLDGQGRIVAVGVAGTRAFVVRLSPDGHVDRLGPHDLDTPEPTDETTAKAVAVRPDGMILVSGTVRRGSTFQTALWSVGEYGAPDPAFGSSGLAAFPVFGATDPTVGLTLLPDLRIAVAVNVSPTPGDDDEHNEAFLLRLLPNGAPDPDFGTNGFLRAPLGEGDVLTSIGHTGDGDLVLGLRLRPGYKGGQHAALARVWR